MPERCVAARCDNTADPTKGISMHRFPFLNSENPIAQRRRKKWIDFVLSKRKNWVPGKTSSLCSVHFKEEDFQFRLDSKMKRSLKSDEIGICVYPSIHALIYCYLTYKLVVIYFKVYFVYISLSK